MSVGRVGSKIDNWYNTVIGPPDVSTGRIFDVDNV